MTDIGRTNFEPEDARGCRANPIADLSEPADRILMFDQLGLRPRARSLGLAMLTYVASP